MMMYSRLLSIWKEVNTELMEDVGVCNSCWTGSFLTHTSCVKRPIGISPSNSPLHWRIKTENWNMKNTIDISYYSIILYSKDTCLLISLPCFIIWNYTKRKFKLSLLNFYFDAFIAEDQLVVTTRLAFTVYLIFIIARTI